MANTQVAVFTSVLALINLCACANILMITMGGTKSHKIPFGELARGLIRRGHNVTFVSAFPADTLTPGMEEITPTGFVFYVKNFTNWDLVGARMRGEEPVPFYDALRYGYEACEALLSDPETKDLIKIRQTFDLAILDGAYPECALGIVHHFNVPYIYINTVGFYTGSLSLAGNPAPYSVTPFFTKGFTDTMTLPDRVINTGFYFAATLMHMYVVRRIQDVLRKRIGPEVPPIYEMGKNVSFILQNAHATVTYPRAYLPNVAEIACIHCKAAKALPKDLEDFIQDGGDAGFIYFSMGSSVKAANMPEYLRRLIVRVFEQLPYRILWKWESAMADLPSNVKLSRWLPQQDLLGHKKIRAFVTHGGLLSMFETVFHGVPVVTIPVFCDHDSNAAKAELDGYALKLDLQSLTSESLLWAIRKVIRDPKYRQEVKRRQLLLRDQKESPLERGIYWTEYVIRHRGAQHLQSPARNYNFFQYFSLDVFVILFFLFLLSIIAIYYVLRLIFSLMTMSVSFGFKHKNKIE